jgi:phosphatidylinositol-3-phosphatase
VTPNLCNDTHDCSVQTGDSWLQGFLPKVFSSAQYQAGKTAVFLTWDENDGSAGNHIATLVMAPSVVPGTISSTAFTHYSMLRSTEELLGLGSFLGNAATATSMRPAFNL